MSRTIEQIRTDLAAAKLHGNSWANETWLRDGEGQQLVDRIEELEAALREIVEMPVGQSRPLGVANRAADIARQALNETHDG